METAGAAKRGVDVMVEGRRGDESARRETMRAVLANIFDGFDIKPA